MDRKRKFPSVPPSSAFPQPPGSRLPRTATFGPSFTTGCLAVCGYRGILPVYKVPRCCCRPTPPKSVELSPCPGAFGAANVPPPRTRLQQFLSLFGTGKPRTSPLRPTVCKASRFRDHSQLPNSNRVWLDRMGLSEEGHQDARVQRQVIGAPVARIESQLCCHHTVHLGLCRRGPSIAFLGRSTATVNFAAKLGR